MKNQKGITLVALVITIIVLLILAGVSISLVVGNNGVLTNATKAVSTNNRATVEQEIKMAAASCYSDYMAAWASDATVNWYDFFTATKGKGMNYYVESGTVTITTEINDETGDLDSISASYTSSDVKDGVGTITFDVYKTGDVKDFS